MSERVRRLAPFIVAGLLGVVALVGLFARGGGPFGSSADYRELCELECACTGCIVDECEANYRRLAEEQGECRPVGDALVECKTKPGGGECQSSGGLTAFMPVGACEAAARELLECFHGGYNHTKSPG